MLSVGIRFGQGLDKGTIHKMLQLIPSEFDYDLLVIGSNPGGVECAREAKLANKKVAIIKITNFSPAEEEGFDEDLEKMGEALEVWENQNPSSAVPDSQIGDKTSTTSWKKSTLSDSATKSGSGKLSFSVKSSGASRKVRQSRLDLNNELFKRGQHCRKLMHNATILGDLAETAHMSGWRIVTATSPISINWKKMSEEIMDYVMKENWSLQTALEQENVDIIEGFPNFIDEYTVNVCQTDGCENNITAAVICLAIPSACILPEEVRGAIEYGITYDDFIRMDKAPGNTLIVGATKEGLECAGIVAGCKLHVTVVSRSYPLKNYDSEITGLIINDLQSRGVKFLNETTLTSIKKTTDNKLSVTFTTTPPPDDTSVKSNVTKNEVFDTVVFAVGRKVNIGELNLSKAGIEIDPNTERVMADVNGTTSVPHIYAVGDTVAGLPDDYESCMMDGKLLGRRLFHNETEVMDYFVMPSVIYTPREYAFVGISEDDAIFRLGEQCVDVYYGDFKPLDFIIPAKKGTCFAKIIVFKSNGAIIGLHIFGPEAGEMIQGFAAAIKTGLTITNFHGVVGATGTKVQEISKLRALRTNLNGEECCEEEFTY